MQPPSYCPCPRWSDIRLPHQFCDTVSGCNTSQDRNAMCPASLARMTPDPVPYHHGRLLSSAGGSPDSSGQRSLHNCYLARAASLLRFAFSWASAMTGEDGFFLSDPLFSWDDAAGDTTQRSQNLNPVWPQCLCSPSIHTTSWRGYVLALSGSPHSLA